MTSLGIASSESKHTGENLKGTDNVEVHPLSKNPHAWAKLKHCKMPIALSPIPTLKENCIRFVCISDTHSQVEHLAHSFARRIPSGDVLLHAGDFTLHGNVDEFTVFNDFLAKLDHRIKLIVPGNHETTLDPRGYGYNPTLVGLDLIRELGLSLKSKDFSTDIVIKHMKQLISQGLILQDSYVEICGIKIYGLPWVPAYGAPGFGLQRGHRLLMKYNQVPKGIDVLLSHGPPVGFGDKTTLGKHVGCVELRNCIQKLIKPKYVVSGHIHEGYGIETDGTTTYINASVCNKHYKPVNEPIVFDMELPHPFTREDFLQLEQSDLVVVNCSGQDMKK